MGGGEGGEEGLCVASSVTSKKDGQAGTDDLMNSSAIYDKQGLRHITDSQLNIAILMSGSHREFDV
jgi:hypothetical protein